MPQIKKWVQNLILLVFTLIICLIILEIFIRLFFPVNDTIWLGDKIIGHIHMPDKQGVRYGEEYKTKLNFNDRGFHDIDHKIENPKSKTRIVFLGDSFVDALEVDFNESFVQQYQKRLDNYYPEKYEVFNFGLYYFSTAQEYLLYKNYVKGFSPNEVYLFVFFNDPYEICLEDVKNPTFYLENGEVKAREFTPNRYSNLQIFISNHLKSSIFFRERFNSIRKNFNEVNSTKSLPPATKVFLKDYDNQTKECLNLFEHFIKELKSEVISSGANLTAFIIPHPASINDTDKEKFLQTYGLDQDQVDFLKPNREFIDVFEKQNISYVNLYDHLKHREERIYYLLDGHFNPKGHQIIADLLLERLINQEKGVYSCQITAL